MTLATVHLTRSNTSNMSNRGKQRAFENVLLSSFRFGQLCMETIMAGCRLKSLLLCNCIFPVSQCSSREVFVNGDRNVSPAHSLTLLHFLFVLPGKFYAFANRFIDEPSESGKWLSRIHGPTHFRAGSKSGIGARLLSDARSAILQPATFETNAQN